MAKDTGIESYRKLDQSYIDNYDRYTITELKKLEEKEIAERKAVKTIEEELKVTTNQSISFASFHNEGIRRARNKEEIIRKQKQQDDEQDRLVRQYPPPQDIKCNTCGIQMNLCMHFFKEGDAKILFVFECPNGHSPRKAIYPNGTEYIFTKRRCRGCDGELITSSKKKKNKIIFTDTCTTCKKKSIDEFDNISEEESINEADRKKYCTDFINRRTFEEDLKALADWAIQVDEVNAQTQAKEYYGFDKIQKINIPHLEQRLSQLTEKAGYIKLAFEKPNFLKQLTIEFSIQDPTDRKEKESIKKLEELLKQDLFNTNWRLMTTGISYRLGFLTGKLKGYEHDEDILRLAKEVFNK